jgi:tetratricopeptide (TPR) repeat protein
MEKEENVFKNEITVKQGLSFVAFYFITLTDWDRTASISSMIYRDDGVPARGAHQRKMYYSDSQISDSLFYKELSLYPDNYSAYRDKWFMASITQKGKVDSVVGADMKHLAKKVKDEPVEYLYALSYGYLLLKQEEESRSIIKKLIERYPTSPLTGKALDSYEYQAFAQQLKGEGPEEIKELKRNYITLFPNTRYAREQIRILAHKEDFPLEAVEEICLLWKEKEPDHPWPYYSLATAYLKHNEKLDKASQLMDKAITLMLQGKLRLYEDISGGITKMTLPRAYVSRAEIAMKRNN